MRSNKQILNFLVNNFFTITANILLSIGRACHMTYNAVNIVIWYGLLPLLWMTLLDYKLHSVLLSPLWLLLCIGVCIIQRKKFNRFCDALFRLSQEFILLFGNYYLWSVIICLILPVLITILLIIA